jgi:hypothetical protein
MKFSKTILLDFFNNKKIIAMLSVCLFINSEVVMAYGWTMPSNVEGTDCILYCTKTNDGITRLKLISICDKVIYAKFKLYYADGGDRVYDTVRVKMQGSSRNFVAGR